MYCYLVEKFDVDGELVQSVIGPFDLEDDAFRTMKKEAEEDFAFFSSKGNLASFITKNDIKEITLFVNSNKNTTYKVLPLERRD